MASMAIEDVARLTVAPTRTVTLTTVPGSGATSDPCARWSPTRGKRSISSSTLDPSGPSTHVRPPGGARRSDG